MKKSIHMAAAITLALASSAHAKCPARLSGTYSGYATLDSANSGDSSEIHGKRVKLMTLRSDGTASVREGGPVAADHADWLEPILYREARGPDHRVGQCPSRTARA